jgi:hypothetical protein
VLQVVESWQAVRGRGARELPQPSCYLITDGSKIGISRAQSTEAARSDSAWRLSRSSPTIVGIMIRNLNTNVGSALMLIKKIYICYQLVGNSYSPFLTKGFYRIVLPQNPPVLAPALENRLITSTGRREIEMHVDPVLDVDFLPARSRSPIGSNDPFEALVQTASNENVENAFVGICAKISYRILSL